MDNKLKISENTVVHCETEQDVKDLFTLAENLGLKWQNGNSYLDVNTLSNFCYDLHKGGRAYKEYYVNRDYTVISAQDFIDKHTYISDEMQANFDKMANNLTEHFNKKPKIDLVVEAVREDLLRRSQVGIKKYGVTLLEGNYTHQQILQHAYEEALDLANYLKTTIIQLENAKTNS